MLPDDVGDLTAGDMGSGTPLGERGVSFAFRASVSVVDELTAFFFEARGVGIFLAVSFALAAASCANCAIVDVCCGTFSFFGCGAFEGAEGVAEAGATGFEEVPPSETGATFAGVVVMLVDVVATSPIASCSSSNSFNSSTSSRSCNFSQPTSLHASRASAYRNHEPLLHQQR